MVYKIIVKFVKKHKKFFMSFLGIFLVIQILFVLTWFLAVIDSIIYYNSNNAREPLRMDKDLVATDSVSLAIDMEVLLAKHGIRVERFQDGCKTRLILPRYRCRPHQRRCTQDDYDLAIIILSKSGLNNKNSEINLFDKTNIFSSKEEIRAKLTNDMNEKLSNLIKRLECIENAEVFVSIPEQTMFSKEQKPIKAVIQVSTAGDYKLDQRTVSTIYNLMQGSVSGLLSENINLSDTNNNIYYLD